MNYYKSYSCSLTTKYKCGHIHSAYIDDVEVVQVSVDKYAYVQYVKSYHAAKLLITKHLKSGRALK